MSLIESAKKRMQQRSKLPPGGKIVKVECSFCSFIQWYWCDDPRLWLAKKSCLQCKHSA